MQLSFSFVLFALFAAKVAATSFLSPRESRSNAAEGLRLLRFSPKVEPVWKTEQEKLELMRSGVHFFDITGTYEREQRLRPLQERQVENLSFGEPCHQSAVKEIIRNISIPNMRIDLTKLTSFKNRYYNTTTGVEASKWIFKTVQEITSGRTDVNVSSYKHPFPQFSTVVRFAGKSTLGPATIVGAHMDSVNFDDMFNGTAPGADDNGSGAVNLIETLRVLVNAGFTPSNPLEFHWYAAEEVGLEGSNDIATKYSEEKIPVKAYLQLDMTAYFKPGSEEVMALNQDYTNPDLNAFVEQLIGNYTRLPVAKFECGYACSDHASWEIAGVPAAFITEAPMGDHNPVIHTANDTIDAEGFSWEHSIEFTKLALAFAYELSA